MFQPGDKVRFLNESIEGEIIRKIGGDRFEVVDKDGFTHHVGQRELVAISFVPSPNSTEQELPTAPPVVKPIAKTDDPNHLIQYFEEDGTVYGVLELLDPASPLTSDVALWLINATDMHLTFVAVREKGDYRTHPVVGQLKPRSEHSVDIYAQDQLYKMDGVEFQFIFYSTSEFRPRSPLVKHMGLRPGELLEAASRSGNVFERTVKIPLVVLREEQVDVTKLLKRFTVDEDDMRTRQQIGRGKGAKAFSVLSREKVVDLHIDALLKDTSGMSAGQMIAYQLSVFDKEMNLALLDHLNRITFVHGVGNGVLRSAIREELKKFDHIHFSDAPTEKFGNGATQVDFK
ncbi:MAG: hypothetical protein RIQ47_1188 [Bacteroidota bacterium]|jgi:hypothetical protein